MAILQTVLLQLCPQFLLLAALAAQVIDPQRSSGVAGTALAVALLLFFVRAAFIDRAKVSATGLGAAVILQLTSAPLWALQPVLGALALATRKVALLLPLVAVPIVVFAVAADAARDDFLPMLGEQAFGLRVWYCYLGLLLLRQISWIAAAAGGAVAAAMTACGFLSIEEAQVGSTVLALWIPRGSQRDARALRIVAAVALGLLGALIVWWSSTSIGAGRCAPDFELPELNYSVIAYLFIAEDPRYPLHTGVDAHRLRTAVREWWRDDRARRGGSTIEMQLAKLCWLSYEKSPERKLTQLILAWRLHFTYSKQELLALYLNNVPFGPGVIGISAAAQHYFATMPAFLSDTQSLRVVLAIFDPVNDPPDAPLNHSARLRAAVIKGRLPAYLKHMGLHLKFFAAAAVTSAQAADQKAKPE